MKKMNSKKQETAIIYAAGKENSTKNRKYKQLILVAVVSANIITTLPATLLDREAEAQQTVVINWGAICRNPMVDAFIVEPCYTLTTPDGYTLTAEGERVIKCIAGGVVLLLVDPSGQTLAAAKALGPAVGCGSSGGTPTGLPVSDIFTPSNQRQDRDPLGNILRDIFN
jgi:hypothetical protein